MIEVVPLPAATVGCVVCRDGGCQTPPGIDGVGDIEVILGQRDPRGVQVPLRPLLFACEFDRLKLQFLGPALCLIARDHQIGLRRLQSRDGLFEIPFGHSQVVDRCTQNLVAMSADCC